MATLAEIRQKLKEQEARASGENKFAGDGAVYPFWNLKDGTESVVRFLPDGNPNNTFFWIERAMIKLPFAGIKGQAESKATFVNVPCMEMYGDSCPILTEVRPWFKDPKLEELGRRYWKKRSFIFQGFVVDDGLKEEQKPENPIRRFIIGPQIFQLIKSALLDPEIDDMPTDYTAGLDFKLIKGTKGGYADYSTSKWGRRSRPLDRNEQDAIKNHGLTNLVEFLPKKPSEAEIAIIKEMFEASVDGEAYDPTRWGQFFKPAGLNTADTAKPAAVATQASPVAAAPVASSAPWDEEEPAPVQAKPAAAPAPTGGRAEDILAMIRNRQKA